MKSLYEKSNGSYVDIFEIKVPTLVSLDTNHKIGFWGQLHKEYLKQNHRVIYYNLLTQGKLNSHLYDIDIRARKQNDLLVKQLAESQGITEKFKIDKMLWVQIMNNIANQAKEIVYNEIIYQI